MAEEVVVPEAEPRVFATGPGWLPEGLRFLSVPDLPTLFNFPLDMTRVPTEVNRLSNQVLVQTFEDEWGKVHQ